MSPKLLLVPLGVILLSFGQLVHRGHDATGVVGENLPNPHFAPHSRLVDLVHPTRDQTRNYELTFERPEAGSTTLRADAQLSVQLSSAGRTRILVIRPAGSSPSRWHAFLDLLRGRGRLQIAADRKWVDLGPLPADGAMLKVQVTGFLPGAFGFAELNKAANPLFGTIRIERLEAPVEDVLTTIPRYRLTAPAPVAAKETLARFFFFVSISRVLQATGLLALVLLFAGWHLLGKSRMTGAVCCLIPSVVLFHAVCLPPLQGADETSHGATIEALLFRGMPIRGNDVYPRSWSLVAKWLEQDRVQYQPEERLQIGSPAEREALALQLREGLQSEAREAGPLPPGAAVEVAQARSPFFFGSFALAGALRPLPVIDRISAYRVLAAFSGLILFCAGALLLHRAGLDARVVLCYGLVWLVPYMVITVASISNYATAIGLGSLLAACALVLILSGKRRQKITAAGLLVAGSWLGIPLWPDFVLLAPIVTSVVALGGLRVALRNLRPSIQRALLAAGAAILLGAVMLFAVVALRTRLGDIGTRMPRNLPKTFDRNAFWMTVAVAAPLALAALLALAVQRLGTLPPARSRRILVGASVTLAAVFLAGFLLTPWTSIPYETDFYWFSKFVRENVKVFLSNSLAWDQDTLSWKFYVGAGGWHDVFYPDWLYAATKWAFVLFLISLPASLIRRAELSIPKAATLVLVAGFAASLSVATLTLRYIAPMNPFGRFLLPWLPLLLTPLLIPFAAIRESRPLRLALRVGVLLQIWTAISILGTRYLFGQS